MKLLFIFLLVLIITTAAMLLALNEPGYVLLGVGRKAVQMPLMDFMVLLSALFILFYILLNAFLSMKKAPKRMIKSLSSGRTNRARKGLTNGLLEMAEGNWAKAEKLLTASADKGESPMLNYLAAAKSAEHQDNLVARDAYLAKAAEAEPAAGVAVGLTQAELLENKGQSEEALTTLRRLNGSSPQHPQVQKQLVRTLLQHQQWDELSTMLPDLKKNKLMSDEEKSSTEGRVWAQILQQAGSDRDRKALDGIWKKLSRQVKVNPAVLGSYCLQLIKLKDSAKAEPLLRKSLDANWNDDIVAVYGQLELDKAAVAIKHAEGWLKDHPGSAELLAAAGKLNAREKVWGKAKNFLQESLEIKPVTTTHRAMARLLDSLGEGEAAKMQYKEGLELAARHGVSL